METSPQPTSKLRPVRLRRATEAVLFVPLVIFVVYISYLLLPYIAASPYIIFPLLTIAFIFTTIKGVLLHVYSRILLVIIALLDSIVLAALIYLVYGFVRDAQGDICTYTFFTSSVVSCAEYHSITLLWMTALYGIIPITLLMAIGSLGQFFTLRKYSNAQSK